MLTLRRYQPTDHAAVWHLHVLALEQVGAYLGNGIHDEDMDDIKRVYCDNHGEFLVGSEDERLVAMGALRRTDDERVELKRMRVHPDYQGRGYGAQLLLILETRARELGYSIIHLDTSSVQLAAQKLYHKHGFVETHRQQFAGLELIFMEKRLE